MIIDHEKKEVKFKIVYHGPALSGKTTNIIQISKKRGENVLCFNTQEERTLVFDMTKETRNVEDFKATFIIYTIPGQAIYSDIRKMVMRGADAVVFVADSSEKKLKDNVEFIKVLESDLSLYGKSVEETPIIVQYNKRDLEDALPVEVLEKEVNIYGKPYTEAIAIKGEGVEETLNKVIEETLNKFGELVR